MRDKVSKPNAALSAACAPAAQASPTAAAMKSRASSWRGESAKCIPGSDASTVPGQNSFADQQLAEKRCCGAPFAAASGQELPSFCRLRATDLSRILKTQDISVTWESRSQATAHQQ